MDTTQTPSPRSVAARSASPGIIDRRRAPGLIGASAAGALVVARSGIAAAKQALTVIPQETAGPYPADGSNGPNVLTQSGIVRADMRSSFGSMTGTAAGVSTDMIFTVVSAATGAPIANAAVYLWHCDADGKYSVYDLPNANYLRAVQVTAADGTVKFTTIYPGCYNGRWPHMHFEVYESLAAATGGTAKPVATSQVALTKATSAKVYTLATYAGSAAALNNANITTDNVFSDGATSQTPSESGSETTSLTLRLTVPVNMAASTAATATTTTSAASASSATTPAVATAPVAATGTPAYTG